MVTDSQWRKVTWKLEEGKLNIQLDELSVTLNVDVTLTLLHQQDQIVTVYMGARPFVPGYKSQSELERSFWLQKTHAILRSGGRFEW